MLGALSIVSAVSLVADALSPLLLPHAPLALVALSPRSMYVVAVAHEVPLLLLVPLVTMRLCLTDPVHFELGRRMPIGPTGHGVVGRVGRQLRRCVDAVPGFGFLITVAAWPVSHALLAAGAGGARRYYVAIADVMGTLVRVAIMCFVLARIDTMVSAAHAASHVGPLAAVSFVTYATIAMVMRRRQRAAADKWDDIASQVESLRLEDRVREIYRLSWTELEPARPPSSPASVAAAS